MKTTTEKLTELLRSEKAELEKLLPGNCVSLEAEIGTTGRIGFAVYCYENEPFNSTSQVAVRADTMEEVTSDLLTQLDPATKAAELRKKADEIAKQIARLESAKG
jgi:hypothetical protein